MQDQPKDGVLHVIEEQASVTKRKVPGGRIRVSTETLSEDYTLPVDLESVETDVVRVPVDRQIDAVPDVVTRGDVTIIPVVEERVVITRELWLREEIHVRRHTTHEVSDVAVTLRRQVANVERIADPSSSSDST